MVSFSPQYYLILYGFSGFSYKSIKHTTDIHWVDECWSVQLASIKDYSLEMGECLLDRPRTDFVKFLLH